MNLRQTATKNEPKLTLEDRMEQASRFLHAAIQRRTRILAEMRDKATTDVGETKMAALKRVSKDTAKASQAQALTIKRDYLITELGRKIHSRTAQMGAQELSDESAAIADIEHRVRDREDEMQTLTNESILKGTCYAA